jgi:quinoprotein glucose dehydrogenase
VPALAVTTKSGYLYILNRETGEPVYAVEERAVPRSEVPGEQSYPTQPIPAVIPPLAKTSFVPADLVRAQDTNAEHAAACQALLESNGEVVNNGAFTPWVYRPQGTGNQTTLLFPGLTGGPNWGGVAHDPNTGYVFAFAQDLGSFGWIEEAAADAEFPFVLRGPRPSGFDVAMGDSRWPCQQPPWGRLTAVNTANGEVAWTRPLGITEGLPPERQNTGRPGRAGAIVTAGGLLFMAGTDDNRLRALDVQSGDELWVTTLERHGNANPMTYLGHDGRQYVVIVASDQVVAYAL